MSESMEVLKAKVVKASDAKYVAEQGLNEADAKIKAACEAHQIPTQEDMDACLAAYCVLSEATFALNQVLHALYQAQDAAHPRVCKVDDCDQPHCRKCGHHYDPACGENGVCDGCIVDRASAEAQAITKAYGGNYEAAAADMGW